MSGSQPWQRTEGVIARGPEIVIVEYDPQWPARYASERDSIVAATDELFVEFAHVGSTAVPGLAGKPVIDLLGAVGTRDAVEPHLEELARLGYVRLPFLPGRMFFLKRGLIESYNIHVVPQADFPNNPQLLFRDYLRRHPEVRDEYQRLKCEVVGRIAKYQEYMPAKAAFIERVLAQARAEPAGSF